MGAALHVARSRMGRRGLALAVAGALLGVGFGVSFAGFSTARRTASAYDRMLAEADAEDATASHQGTPAEVATVLDRIDAITAHRYQAGFVGSIEGVDPALTGALLASVDDQFVAELPRLSAGRLPDPGRSEEVFVNDYLAHRGHLAVGDRITLQVFDPVTFEAVPTPATVVGTGSLPREAVIDETGRFGVVMLTRSFYEAHRDLVVFSSSTLSLAPGIDARRDLVPELTAAGFEMSESRADDRQGVADALRPLVVLLAVVGALALLATLVATSQLLQREHQRWRDDDATLTVLGVDQAQRVLIAILSVALMSAAAAAVAVLVLLAASPLAPAGPLHDADPGQGIFLDDTVAVAGVVVIALATTLLAAGYALTGGRRRQGRSPRVSRVLGLAKGPTALAGLTLALRTSGDRSRLWRSVGFAVASVALASVVVTVVSSAVVLSAEPVRYGVGWDVMAVNPFGDQVPEALGAAFGGDEVESATSYSAWTFIVDGQAVPGIAADDLKGSVGPTVLDGAPVRADDEVLLGPETMQELGVGLDDRVEVQIAGRENDRAVPPVELRVVGSATFPSVVQSGADSPRLGHGALVTGATYRRMAGLTADEDGPEWTVASLADGVAAAEVIDANPGGIADARGIPTTWYTDAKPAELRQLDSARSLLVGAVAVAYLIVVAVVVHALWSAVREHRRDLAVLGSIGFTRRQLSRVTSWQAAPLLVAILAVGVPVGIAAGRWVFSMFARSIGVVDTAASPPAMAAGLVLGVVVATVLGTGAAARVARRAPSAIIRRER